jgi:hypothetical protein
MKKYKCQSCGVPMPIVNDCFPQESGVDPKNCWVVDNVTCSECNKGLGRVVICVNTTNQGMFAKGRVPF